MFEAFSIIILEKKKKHLNNCDYFILETTGNLDLNTILKSINLNDSDFETYYLSKGYEYMPEVKKMICFDENYNIANFIQKSFSTDTIINYSTISKSNYLELKTDVVNLNFKYLKKEETDKSTSYFYLILLLILC